MLNLETFSTMAWSKFLIKKVYAETDVVFLPDEKSFIGEKQESTRIMF